MHSVHNESLWNVYNRDYDLDAELAELPPAKVEDPLKAWRSGRLGLMKQRPEYKGLPLVHQQIVDFLVRHHEHPINGAFPAQSKLAQRFKVCRQTMNRYLGQIVAAKVLTASSQPGNRRPGKGGRATITYRLNDALFTSQGDTTHDTTGDIEATQLEAPLRGAVRSS